MVNFVVCDDDVVRGQRKNWLWLSIHPVCCTFYPSDVNGTILTFTPLRHTTLPITLPTTLPSCPGPGRPALIH